MEETTSPQGAETPKKQTLWQSIWELVRFALLALIIVIPFRTFIAQPFLVSGSSMTPTFENSQYLIVDEISYRLGTPDRDDVVVFKYPKDTSKFFIKRIIGLPGETVDIDGQNVKIINSDHPAGFVLTEPYIKEPFVTKAHITLGDDEYFVMGDNRNGSSDSRYWGPVPRNLLMGRVVLRLFPLSKLSFLPGSYEQANQ